MIWREPNVLLMRVRKVRDQIARFVVGQRRDNRTVDDCDFVSRAIVCCKACRVWRRPCMVKTLAESMDLAFHRIQFHARLDASRHYWDRYYSGSPQTGIVSSFFSEGLSSLRCCWLTRSIELLPRHKPHCWKRCRSMKSRSGGKRTNYLNHSLFSQHRIRLSKKEHIHYQEAQRDRFLFQVVVEYPTLEQEAEIIDRTTSNYSSKIEAVLTGQESLNSSKP